MEATTTLTLIDTRGGFFLCFLQNDPTPLEGTTISRILLGASCLVLLVNCASTQSAGSIAARRNADPVSDAEYKQAMKQQDIEQREVYLERQKRDNAVDTIWDVNSSISGVKSIGRNLGL